MKIKLAKTFKKQFEKAPESIKKAVNVRMVIFSNNASDPVLHNHHLSGKYSGCKSINITGDWRAVYRESYGEEGRIVEFVALGTHSYLYK